jgi:hypothetical protein
VSDVPWRVGRRAPLIGEDTDDGLSTTSSRGQTACRSTVAAQMATAATRRGTPMALDGVRILDFTWFLASAGGTRFPRRARRGEHQSRMERHPNPASARWAQSAGATRAAPRPDRCPA